MFLQIIWFTITQIQGIPMKIIQQQATESLSLGHPTHFHSLIRINDEFITAHISYHHHFSLIRTSHLIIASLHFTSMNNIPSHFTAYTNIIYNQDNVCPIELNEWSCWIKWIFDEL